MGNVTLYIFKSEVGEHAPRRTAINPDNAPGYRLVRVRGRRPRRGDAELDGQVEWVRRAHQVEAPQRHLVPVPAVLRPRRQHALRHRAAHRRPAVSCSAHARVLSLAGRVALVTGAARGMGAAHALTLAARGAGV